MGWDGPHQGGSDIGSDRNNLELNIVTEQPRKREDEEEQESSLESQAEKFPPEEQSSIEESSSPSDFGFEKNFLRLRKVSADASAGYNERTHQGGEEARDEEDGQEDDNSLDSGFQESRLQDLEAQMKRSSQLSRISFDKETSSHKKGSQSSRLSSEAEMCEQESVKKWSQSSRLSHVIWSKGSSDTDDEGEEERKANIGNVKDAEKEKNFNLQNEEIEKEGKEDESSSNMEKAEESMMDKVGWLQFDLGEFSKVLESLLLPRRNLCSNCFWSSKCV